MIPFDFQPESSNQAQEGGVVVPANVESKAALFVFLREALSLPDYFGNNWDALEECLTDLSWLTGSKITLIHQDIPLKNHPSDQRVYLEILAIAAQESDRIHVFFQEQDRAQIAHILAD